MFYKLVQSTDFDAIDGGMMMTAKEIIAVISADSEKDAMRIFEFMKAKNVIYFTPGAVEIEPANRDEFEEYMKYT